MVSYCINGNPRYLENRLGRELAILYRRFERMKFDVFRSKALELVRSFIWKAYLAGFIRARNEYGKGPMLAMTKEDLKILKDLLEKGEYELDHIIYDIKPRKFTDEQRLRMLGQVNVWRAFNHGKNSFFKQKQLWVMWSAINDPKTCLQCQRLHGKIWRADEPHPIPPLHPNCRCILIYYRK